MQLQTAEKNLMDLRQEAVACMGDFVGLEPITWEDFRATVHAIALPSKGGPLAIGLSDGTVWLRNLGTGAVVARLAQHRLPVTALAFTPDGVRLVSGDSGGTIHVWQQNA